MISVTHKHYLTQNKKHYTLLQQDKIHIVNKFVLLAKGQLICMPTLHQILTLSFCAFGKSFDLQIPIINDETQRTMNFSRSS